MFFSPGHGTGKPTRTHTVRKQKSNTRPLISLRLSS